VYAWCLLNKEALGWTGESIICVGDSAGGVLVTNIVQRAIIHNVRIPDVLVPIYTPFLCTYSLSPSRLLSIMDPLLNYGILWRCLAAYCGISSVKTAIDPEQQRKWASSTQLQASKENGTVQVCYLLIRLNILEQLK
jgi:hypothetical protein